MSLLSTFQVAVAPIFKQSLTIHLLHPSITCLSCSKTDAFLTYRRCKYSSSHSGPHTLPASSRAEWNFCVETGGCSLHLSDRTSPLRWRHPGLWASACRTRWQTAGAGSRAEPLNPEETGTGSGGAWPDPGIPGGGQGDITYCHCNSKNLVTRGETVELVC